MIIGIAGYKSSGKGTAGSILVDKYKFQEKSFASPIKDLVSTMFGLDRDMLEGNDCKLRTIRDNPNFGAYGKSGRELLQVIGTGMRHIVDTNIWVDMAIKQCVAKENYVFTDVRFPNEVEAIAMAGGFTVGVKRQGFNGDAHESERALDGYALPYIVHNDGSMEDLRNKIDRLVGDKLK